MLQIEILERLRDEPARSISVLADIVNATRPSVSRSLHTLEEQGYVQRQGRSWHLTEVGEVEAATAVAKLKDSAEDVIGLAARKFRAMDRIGYATDLVSTFDQIVGFTSQSIQDALPKHDWNALSGLDTNAMESFINGSAALAMQDAILHDMGSVAEQVAAATASGSASDTLALSAASLDALDSAQHSMISVGSVLDTLDAAGSAAQIGDYLHHSLALDSFSSYELASIRNSFVHGIGDAAMSLVGAQQDYASLLELIPPMESLLPYDSVALQTNLLADAMDHVLALQRADASMLSLQSSEMANVSWAFEQMDVVTSSLSDFFRDELELLRLPNVGVTLASVAEQMILSTVPVTHYLEATRYLVDAAIEPSEAPPAARHRMEDVGNQRLDPLLRRLDPNFVDMRHGAWIALNGDNPDRWRHAASSQRNLLTQLLRTLAPEMKFTDDNQPGSQMKERVKVLISGSNSGADFVKHVSDAVYSYYAQLNKFDHTNQKHGASLRAILHAGEGLMEFLLVNLSTEEYAD